MPPFTEHPKNHAKPNSKPRRWSNYRHAKELAVLEPWIASHSSNVLRPPWFSVDKVSERWQRNLVLAFHDESSQYRKPENIWVEESVRKIFRLPYKYVKQRCCTDQQLSRKHNHKEGLLIYRVLKSCPRSSSTWNVSILGWSCTTYSICNLQICQRDLSW